MYKEASRRKLRIQTPKGLLSVEQLWSLDTKTLRAVNIALHEDLKKQGAESELDYLNDTHTKVDTLAFDIVKDIYLTKQREAQQAVSDKAKAAEREKIATILANRQDKALENLSDEELQKRLESLS